MQKQKENTKKKRIHFGNILGIILFLSLGGICGYLGGLTIGQDIARADNIVFKLFLLAWIIISMYIAIFIQLIIHEGGHYIFGRLSGYKFASFRIGNFMFLKENGELKCKKFNIVGTGGQCLMIPPECNDYNYPFLIYNFGGALLNVIASTIFLILYFLLSTVPYLSNLILALCLIGFAFAIMNGIPMRLGSVDNDGYNVLSLRKSKEARRSFWLLFHINGLITNGTRLKDMPEEWFSIPDDADLNNPLICSLAVFDCNRAVDCMDFEKAKKLGEFILEHAPKMIGVHKNELLCDLLFCKIIGQNRKEEIDKIYTKELKQYIKATSAYPSRQRLLYAYELLVEKDNEKVVKRLETFDKITKTAPHKCEVESERELIAYTNSILKGM